jgi:hypothetical protein
MNTESVQLAAKRCHPLLQAITDTYANLRDYFELPVVRVHNRGSLSASVLLVARRRALNCRVNYFCVRAEPVKKQRNPAEMTVKEIFAEHPFDG